MAIKIVDCRSCQHYKYCKSPCPAADYYADGNIPQREQQISSIIVDSTGQQDYNAVLAEYIEDQRTRDANRVESIRSIQDYRLRIIAAATLVNIPQRIIAKMSNQSQANISKLYQHLKPQ